MTFSTSCSYITVNKWNLLNVPLKCDVIFIYKTFSISIHRAEYFSRLISPVPERNDPVEDGAASRCDEKLTKLDFCSTCLLDILFSSVLQDLEGWVDIPVFSATIPVFPPEQFYFLTTA